MSPRIALLLFSVACLVLPLAPAGAWAHDAPVPHVHPTFVGRFPLDYGAINVTQLGANSAIPDDGQDDTAALLKVFNDSDYDPSTETVSFRKLMPKTVYLPAGTYDVSAPIIVASSTLRIVGDGPDRTIIRLAAGSPEFNDRNNPRPVLKTGNHYQTANPDKGCTQNWANCGFANYIQDLGVVIAPGNPGAIGIRYDVANVGVMRNVSVRAALANDSGLYGISFETAPGPGYVDNVSVVGFDYGVYLDDMPINVLTFSNLRVASSRIASMLNRAKTVVLERFTSDSPTAIIMQSPSASVTLVSSTLNGPGSGPAVRLEADSPPCLGSAGQAVPGPLLYARKVTLRGFSEFASKKGVSLLPGVSHITEWATVKAYVGATSRSDWPGAGTGPSLMLNIVAPRMDPLVDPVDPGQWLNAEQFIQMEDNGDIGPALQRAINLRPRVVYLPWKEQPYELRSQVNVTGPVQHIDFGFAQVRVGAGGGMTAGLLVNADQVTLLDNVATNIWIASESKRAVLIRDVSAFGGYFEARANSAALFVENAGSKAAITVGAQARAFARSVDRSTTTWLNNGGTLWCLSCNVEEKFSPIKTSNGGLTEILGGTIDKHTPLCPPVNPPLDAETGCEGDQALFKVEGPGSRMSVLMT